MERMEVDGTSARVRIRAGAVVVEGWAAPPLYLQRPLAFADSLWPYADTPLTFEGDGEASMRVRLELASNVTSIGQSPERRVLCDDVGPLPGAFDPASAIAAPQALAFDEDDAQRGPRAGSTFELAAHPGDAASWRIIAERPKFGAPFVALRSRGVHHEVVVETSTALVVGWSHVADWPRAQYVGRVPDLARDALVWGRDDSLPPWSRSGICAHHAPLIVENHARRAHVGTWLAEHPLEVGAVEGALVEVVRARPAADERARWWIPHEHLYRCGTLATIDRADPEGPPAASTPPGDMACLPLWTGGDARCIPPRDALERALVTLEQAEAALDAANPLRAISILRAISAADGSERTIGVQHHDHDVGLRADALRAYAYNAMGRLDLARAHAEDGLARWRDLRLLQWWRAVNDDMRRARAASAFGRLLFTRAEVARRAEVETIRFHRYDGPPDDGAMERYLRGVVAPYLAARWHAISRVEDAYVALFDDLVPTRWKVAAAAAMARMCDDVQRQIDGLPRPSHLRYIDPYRADLAKLRKRTTGLAELARH